MAVIEPIAGSTEPFPTPSPTLQALTQAAILLPGLLLTTAQAAEPTDTITLQYSRYSEAARDLINVTSGLPTLAVDTLAVSGSVGLSNGYRLSANVVQDSWSGATPVATSPLMANSNRPVLRNTPGGVITSGASPMLNGSVLLNRALQPVATAAPADLQPDRRNVLVMSSASPEMRQQADVALSLDSTRWNPHVNVGVSSEPDFLSRFLSTGGSVDFNEQLSRLSADVSYTHNSTNAVLDTEALPYLTRNAYASQLTRNGNSEQLHATRSDRSASLGLSQVINVATQLDLVLGVTKSQGYMENPYKATNVIFIGDAAFTSPFATLVRGDMRALLEQRPDQRTQYVFNGHLAHHFVGLDSSLHIDYRHTQDDWSSDTHTLELEWVQPLGDWQLAPYLRAYRQSAANFYTPWLVSAQNYRAIARNNAGLELWRDADRPDVSYTRTLAGEFLDNAGNAIDVSKLNLLPQWQNFSPALLPRHFSSDHRLAAFDTVSAGITFNRKFARGLVIEGGVEFYRRGDALFGGGSNDGGFADVDAWMANVGMRIDLQSTARRLRREGLQSAPTHAEHLAHGNSHAAMAPASLMFVHPAMPRGSFMTGYRYSTAQQRGNLLRGNRTLDNNTLMQTACGTALCSEVPTRMVMGMHMLDLSYALTNAVTLMVMPQFMAMEMSMRQLPVPSSTAFPTHVHGQGDHHSASVADTLAGALWQLPPGTAHALQLGMMLSIPTGKVDLTNRPSFQNPTTLRHVDMQTGSGTWDLMPSLTYNGNWRHGYWGMQLSGIARLQDYNKIGYRLGNLAQYSTWASYAVASGFSTSLSIEYARRGRTHGTIDAPHTSSSPMDFLTNQGGSRWNVGIGLQAMFGGSELSLEWNVPIQQNVRGVQLESAKRVSVRWRYGL